jgi:phosphoribosylformimino-5-aminoimidazole carboxamide ribotide isomerase
VNSLLTPATDALGLAIEFRKRFQFNELYVADLDAIAGLPLQSIILATLIQEGFRLWVDAGISAVEQATKLASLGAEIIVVGLETLPGPQLLPVLVRELGPERLVFSLDMKAGSPIGDLGPWVNPQPGSIARAALAHGFRRVLLLDLAQVGMADGVGVLDLCREIKKNDPGVELAVGGGVRGPLDLRELERCGVDNALVATALHTGRLTAEDLLPFSQH